MLTGDNKVVAQIVANEVGIDEVYAELLPQDKVTIIKRLVAEGHKVAMVGDGITMLPHSHMLMLESRWVPEQTLPLKKQTSYF